MFIISTLSSKINFSFHLFFAKIPIACSITDKHSIFKVEPLNFRTNPINMRWRFYYERAFDLYYPTIVIQADKQRSVIYHCSYIATSEKLSFCPINLNIP